MKICYNNVNLVVISQCNFHHSTNLCMPDYYSVVDQTPEGILAGANLKTLQEMIIKWRPVERESAWTERIIHTAFLTNDSDYLPLLYWLSIISDSERLPVHASSDQRDLIYRNRVTEQHPGSPFHSPRVSFTILFLSNEPQENGFLVDLVWTG